MKAAPYLPGTVRQGLTMKVLYLIPDNIKRLGYFIRWYLYLNTGMLTGADVFLPLTSIRPNIYQIVHTTTVQKQGMVNRARTKR